MKIMKKGLLLSVLIMVIATAMAQDSTRVKKRPTFVLGGDGIYVSDSTWKIGGYIGVSVSQTALYQWGPGGNNNIAFLLNASLYANYKKGKMIWDNSLD